MSRAGWSPEERAKAVRDLLILDTPPEPEFDRLAALAARHFGAAVAAVAVLDGDRLWLKARIGLSTATFPATGTAAAIAAESGRAVFAADLAADTLLDADAMARALGARFCIAAPVYAADGVPVGALLVMDRLPRALIEAEDLEDLATLAELVGQKIQQRRNNLSGGLIEAAYRGLLELATSAVIVIDERGTIRAANPATERVFGHPLTRLIGSNVSSLMPEPDRSAHADYLDRYRRTGERRIIGIGREVAGRRADGSTFPMDLRVVEWRDPAGARFFTGVALDISERKAAERALIEARNEATKARELLEDAIESLPEGFGLFDADDRLVAANTRVRALYAGIGEDILVGARYEELLRTTVRRGMFKLPPGTAAEQWVAERLAYHQSPCGVEEIELANGRWVRFQERVTRDGGRVGLRIDITELKQREQALRRSMAAAEAASLAKTQFLATMSHELRTPLNAIIGFSQMLLGGMAGSMSDSATEYLQLIETSGSHLIGIINEVLDLARIDTGEFVLSDQPVDVHRLLAAVVDQSRTLAEANGVVLTLQDSDPCPVLRGDPVRLKQVFANIVSNGVKFAPKGTVTVGVAASESGSLTVTVADTGIGMRPEDIPRALEPFGQLDSGLDRKFEGCGLGLSLAAKLVALHRGEIRIESAPGTGTRVEVRLPLAGEAMGDRAAAGAKR